MNDISNTLIINKELHVMASVLQTSAETTIKCDELRSNGFFILYAGVKSDVNCFKQYFTYNKSSKLYNLYNSYELTDEGKTYSFTHDFEESVKSIDDIFKIKSNFIILSIIK